MPQGHLKGIRADRIAQPIAAKANRRDSNAESRIKAT